LEHDEQVKKLSEPEKSLADLVWATTIQFLIAGLK